MRCLKFGLIVYIVVVCALPGLLLIVLYGLSGWLYVCYACCKSLYGGIICVYACCIIANVRCMCVLNE